MDAKTLNSAEVTPTAESSGSRPIEDTGADTGEMFSKGDLLSELGLRPDGQIQAPAATADDEAETETTDEAQDTATETEATADAESDDAAVEAKSDDETAPTTDAEKESGDSKDSQEETPSEKAKVSPELQQRFDELTFRAKTAEENAAKLREELSAVRASGAVDATALATIDDMPTLQQQRQKAMELHQWAIAHPDGGVLPGGKDGEGVELTREETARIQAQTYRLVHQDIPTREQYLYQRSAADAAAIQSYPWLKNTTAGYGGAVQGAIEGMPALRQFPNYRLIVANAYIGEKLRSAGVKIDDALIARLKAEQSARQPGQGGQPAQRPIPPKAPASPGRAGSVPPRISPRAAEEKANRKRVVNTRGDEDSIAASIGSKL